MIVRELLAKLGIELDKASFTAADVLLQGAKVGLVAIGGAALAAGAGLGALIHSVVETSGQLNDTSQAIGVDVEKLQELAYAAKLNGAGMDEVAVALGKLGKQIYAASQGSEEAQKAFSALGVSVHGAGGQLKTADQVFGEVADRFAKMPDGPKKTALAMEAFGRAGARLVPTLNLGRAGLAAAAAEARELAFVLSKETVAAGDDLGDNLDRLAAGARGLGYSIAGPLLPQINELVLAFLKWVKANRELLAQRVERALRTFIAAGKALVSVLDKLYHVLGFVIDNWRLFAVLFGSVVLAAVLANLGAITTLIGQYIWLGIASTRAALSSAAAWAAANAPVIALAALIAIVILLLEDWLTWMQGGDSILGQLVPRWEKFLQSFASGGSEDEPDWIKFLRFGAALITDLSGTMSQVIEGWKLFFSDFVDWVLGLFEKLGWKLASKVRESVASVRALLGSSGGAGVAGVVGGGGASVAASAAGAASARGAAVVSTETTNDIKIFPPPTAGAQDVAEQTVRAIRAHRQAELEETAAALGGG